MIYYAGIMAYNRDKVNNLVFFTSEKPIDKGAKSCTGSIKKNVADFPTSSGGEGLVIFVSCSVKAAENDSEKRRGIAELEGPGGEEAKDSVFDEMCGFSDNIDEKIDVF